MKCRRSGKRCNLANPSYFRAFINPAGRFWTDRWCACVRIYSHVSSHSICTTPLWLSFFVVSDSEAKSGATSGMSHLRHKRAQDLRPNACIIQPSLDRYIRMLVRIHWISSLLVLALVNALVSASSSHHTTSTTKSCVTRSSSTHHTTLSTTKKTTTSASWIHHSTTANTKKTSSSSKSSTVAPTSTPSTFYLVAADTGSTTFDGSYFRIIIDPFPSITINGDSVIQFANKSPVGAANFTLLADGTLQCNSPSGPLVACVSNGHPETQTFMFENPDHLDEYGFVTATCAIASGVLSCQWFSLVDFVYTASNVENGTQVGEYVLLALAGDDTPFTIRVVPT